MIKTIISIIPGGFLFGVIGSHIFSFHALGFIIGVMIFAVGYCCLTLDDPPDNSNLP